MISASEALAIIGAAVKPLGAVTLSIERALGFALAEEIIAEENIPPFDNSAMDGFAVRTADLQNAPTELSIVAEISAGMQNDYTLQPGEAMAIMTGAPVPEGADAIVQQEWTEHVNQTHVRIMRTVDRGHNIRKAGADIKAGSNVFPVGSEIRPQEIGVLGSLGKRFISVYRKPSIAILATGNELVSIEETPSPGMIRNSNSYSIAALVRSTNCEANHVGIARDNRAEILSCMKEGLKSDVLITSGGVSVGKYDLVLEVLKELAAEVKFHKVNIKPGMPLLFAMCEGKPMFGLPGNPVSSMVTFIKFVRPALYIMMGKLQSSFVIPARLAQEITKRDGKRHFVRGILETIDGQLTVKPTGSQVSNIMTSLTSANCLITLPEEKSEFRIGEMVEVELL